MHPRPSAHGYPSIIRMWLLCMLLSSWAAAAPTAIQECLDIDNQNPPPMWFGSPTVRISASLSPARLLLTTSAVENDRQPQPELSCPISAQRPRRMPRRRHARVQLQLLLSSEHRCKYLDARFASHSLLTSSTQWFWGQPIDLMKGAWCDIGDGCSHAVSFSSTLGNTQTSGHDRSSSSSSLSTSSYSRGQTLTHSAGASLSLGFAASVGFKIPLLASSSMNFGISSTAGTSWSMSEGASESFAKSAAESESYSKGSSTSQNVAVTMIDGSGPKPAWAEKHCGSWYAVPVIAM